MNANEKKEITQIMKKSAKEAGYKSLGASFYKKFDNYLHIVNYVVNKKGFTCYSCIKEERLDYILWDVLDMQENKEGKYSIHVEGAFAAPSIKVDKYFYESAKDIGQTVVELWDELKKDIEGILSKYLSMEEIIFSKEMLSDDEKIIKCLIFIDKREINKAVELAKQELANGNRGKYSNNGLFFYERVVSKSKLLELEEIH